MSGGQSERERDEGDMEGGRNRGADKERKQEKEERNIKKNKKKLLFGTRKKDYFLQ